MKAFLLATAMIAAPVIAQSTTMTQPPAETTTTQTTNTDTTTTTTDTTAPAAPEPIPATDMAAPAAAPMPAPAGAPGVVFQQPQTVEQAFPAPAPKASYPWCSRTVTDGCKQRVDPK